MHKRDACATVTQAGGITLRFYFAQKWENNMTNFRRIHNKLKQNQKQPVTPRPMRGLPGLGTMPNM